MQVTPKEFGSSPLKCEPDAMIPCVTAIAKDVSKQLVAEGSLLFNHAMENCSPKVTHKKSVVAFFETVHN